MTAILCNLILVGGVLAGLSVPAAAETDAAKAREQAATVQATLKDAEEKSVTDFKGMGFGVGVGLSRDIESGHPVQDAQVINGVLRATEVRSDIPRIVLESHYFFVPTNHTGVGWGPFVAVQSGSGEILDAVGTGLMIGFRRAKVDVAVNKPASGEQTIGQPKVDTSSFNLGVGVLLDSRVKVIRDGLKENAAMPSGEEGTPLTRESDRWSMTVLFSFAF